MKRLLRAPRSHLTYSALLLVLAAWFVAAAAPAIGRPGIGFGLFAAAFFVLQSTAARLSGGDPLSNDEAVAVAAMMMLPPTQAALAAALGGGAGRLALAVRGSRPGASVTEVLRRFLVVCLFARAFHVRVPLSSILQWQQLATALALGAAFVVVDYATYCLEYSLRRNLPLGTTFISLIHLAGGLALGQVCLGVAIAVLSTSTGYMGLFLLMGLVLVLRQSFVLYLRIRSAYRDTIAALARAAEMQDPDDQGHSERVALIAVATARELGLRGRRLEQVNYAALLHDVGKIGLAHRAPPWRHAVRGAEIVGSVSFLASTAPAIRYHHGASGEAAPTRMPLDALIIGLADQVDRLSTAGACAAVVTKALDGLEDEYGPDVCRAAARVVARRDFAARLFARGTTRVESASA